RLCVSMNVLISGQTKQTARRVFIVVTLLRCCSSSVSDAGGAKLTESPTLARYFGTKTRYEEVNQYLLQNPLLVDKSLVFTPDTDSCTPLQIVAVIRHGTRYPTTKQIKKMKQVYNLVRDKGEGSGDGVVEALKSWQMWYEDWMDGQLVENGKTDMQNLAFRLATLYPSLLSTEKLRGCHMKFVTSSKHRCVDSTKAFIKGFVENYLGLKEDEIQGVECTKPEINDELMRFFDHCQKFVIFIEENATALNQVDVFKTSAEMNTVLEKLAGRLQVSVGDLTADLVQVAFYLCSFELSIKGINSPWCKIFDQEDAEVLEYLNDLKQYWKRGYGHAINSRSSCILFHNIFNYLDQAVSESER
uniref:Multiple inositol polyphosphate phosphatase 1 n=1 Tax=Latimeria chalumnae TaxID=7897 RepID=H3AV87_LATCH